MRTTHLPQSVSLCTIVEDKEANLRACLESAAALVDEVVVVDIGSTDATREIAAEFGARIFAFAWVDSLRRATGDGAFWLDADNRFRLRELFAALPDRGALKCLCPADPASPADHSSPVSQWPTPYGGKPFPPKGPPG